MTSTDVEHLAGGQDPTSTSQEAAAVLGPIARYEQSVLTRIRDFDDPRQEWRRLFSEVLGTFLLVLVADQRRHDGPSLS
jgi:aquaporin Z